MNKFKRYLELSQINLFAWLLLSSLLASSVVFTNGGVSNYGNHYSTVLFFSAAFLAGSIYLLLAAREILVINQKYKPLSLYLFGLSVLMLLVYITTFPRRFGVIFSDIHDNISIGMFAYELLLAVWLCSKWLKLETLTYMLIMIIGLVIGLLSSLHVIHLMFIGQMVGALGFALLLVRILPKAIDN